MSNNSNTNNRTAYSHYIFSENQEGSARASSYIRALSYLGPIITKSPTEFSYISDIFAVHDPDTILQLYEYVSIQQRKSKKGAGIFNNTDRPSYWRNRFYSSALKDYYRFLLEEQYETRLWSIYKEQGTPPSELAKCLDDTELSVANAFDEEEIPRPEIDGVDVLRAMKTRLNQRFFRKMILCDYSSQCCLTGISIPEVLRASHIIPWAEDIPNRMNPANGLCLSATYDAAFDQHLISFDEDYRLILSPTLSKKYFDAPFRHHFLDLEGKRMTFPRRFKPATDLLAKHREKLQH